MLPRSSGILLPIASLPSPFAIGNLGPSAFRFVDFLHAAGQRVWQVLPLNPTDAACHHSPYYSPSAFAFNPLLISPEILVEDGLLHRRDLPKPGRGTENRVNYRIAQRIQERLLDAACQSFRGSLPDEAYTRFCDQHAAWLEDYARFSVFRSHFRGTAWNQWPLKIRRRNGRSLESLARTLRDEIEHVKILQYLFYRQWTRLKAYCRRAGVRLFGDIPIYVPFDSADVWANRGLFKLDASDRPSAVSGVPPDYFSADGQLWGHPVYRWQAHRETRYAWWVLRVAHNLELFDCIRIDHFRGLVAYWEVPAGESTAIRGKWVQAPTDDFMSELQRRFISLPLIAEDLGYITADVRETMQRYGLPGMRVLMFGFSGDPVANPNAVHNIPEHCVVYTGTHDNNTARGWFEREASRQEKRRLAVVIGRKPSNRELPWDMIRMAMNSPARWCILPVQDVLGLGQKTRINTPGQTSGNWLWRMTAKQFHDLPAKRLRDMTIAFGRG
jgi:4-alpha-glucanotransferase